MKNKKIYIAGHNGMVGSAIWRELVSRGYKNIFGLSKKELDLKNINQAESFFKEKNPDIVIDCAAVVGGIMANSDYPYQFLMDNLKIQNNLIELSLKYNIEKFIFLGSSCIYPKLAPQPISEEYLLSGPLEPTNEFYAIAKISGLMACKAIVKQFGKDFISLMPTNLYGPFDNFDFHTSHVLPAMINKFHQAKMNNNSTVKLWGSGNPYREFLYVDDLAKAVIFVLEKKLDENIYNIGTGKDITIKDLSLLVQKIIGHKGEIIWDKSKPDGTPRKVLDVKKINNAGWKSTVSLESGIQRTYNWFLQNHKTLKKVKF